MLHDRYSIFFYGFICKLKRLNVMKVTWVELPCGLLSEILCPCCATWTWVEVKVPIRVGGVSRLALADWQSGLGMGDIWFLGSRARGGWGWGQLVVKPSAVREQTVGGPNVTQRCTVIYVHSLQGAWLYLKLVVTIINLRLLFLLQYFLVSLILCFGLGVGV